MAIFLKTDRDSEAIVRYWYVIPAIASENPSQYIHHTREAGSRLSVTRRKNNTASLGQLLKLVEGSTTTAAALLAAWLAETVSYFAKRIKHDSFIQEG